MGGLSVSLLGDFAVARDGRPIVGFRSAKVRALLAYLAVEAHRAHSRDALAALLWPECPNASARTYVRQALANLRSVLDEALPEVPFLLVTRDTVQLNPACSYDLDVATFRAVLAACAGHPHRRAAICTACARRLEQALALYRGDFLDGFALGGSAPFEEWLALIRERLHQQAVRALAWLGSFYERRGAYEEAADLARRQLALEPWREEAHQQLMRVLWASGQRSAALEQYARCRRILHAELGVEPEAETTALYACIRDRARSERPGLRDATSAPPRALDPTHDRPGRVRNAPAQTTRLIGRERELEELDALLEEPACRLLTLVGPGGIGKTRLALAAAHAHAWGFADGVAFVPLAGISAPRFVAAAILAALDVALQGPREPREQLVESLGGKELLLVLDNFEHLLAAAPFVAELLQAAPGLTVLVTSRAVLHLSGEHEFAVPPLALPDPNHLPELPALAQSAAVACFIQRAQAVKPDFQLTLANAPTVAEICVRLDGLPLAIQLAAARTKVLTPQALLERLSSRLTLLTGGARDLPARQQTIRATLDWSYRLLSEAEQRLFSRLAVFVAGWTLEAAEAVCTADGELGLDVLNGLQSLLDKSLIQAMAGADGEPHFTMLETIREYAVEQMEASGEGETLRRQHARHYLASAAALQHQFHSSPQRVSVAPLAISMANIRAALQWVLDRGEVELGLGVVEPAVWFWWAPGLWSTWRQGHEALPTRRDPLPLPARAKVLTRLGHYLATQTDPVGALPLLEEGLALWREVGDQAGIAQALRYLADVRRDQGLYAQADKLYQQSLVHYQAIGNTHGSAWVYHGWGEMARLQGDFTRALALGEASLGLFRELGQTLGICHAVLNHGFVEQARGNDEQAATLYKESLLLARTLENPLFVAQCLIGFAGVAVKDPVGPVNAAAAQRAARLLGAAEVMLAASPGPLFHVPRREYERNIAAARTQLDDATFAAAWAEGRAMTLEQAAAYALEEAAEATACPRCTGSGPG